MGLDMYLEGRIYNWTQWENPEGERRPMKDGFEIKEIIIELGYWRKHPNLHGYIVQVFASGYDTCEKIDLGEEELDKIISAIKDKVLPQTSGFFFGNSDGSEDEYSIGVLEKAKQWLLTRVPEESKSVYYRASW